MPKISRYTQSVDSKRLNVSALVMTLNEEKTIGECLDHLQWTDDIVVLDSFSADGTESIVGTTNAKWIQRKFINWADQQNWAMENIPFKYDWVYLCDADERVTAELAEEILSKTEKSVLGDHVAYQVKRRDYYGDTWIRRSTNYPLWIVRLFRPTKIRWNRAVNQVPVVEGSTGYLKNDYIHYPLSKGIANWIGRHNVYSGFEAIELVKSVDNGDFKLSELVSLDRAVRRQALKKLSFRLPGRPILRFVFLYFIKGGILDGRMGLRYCLLKAIYQYLIDIKVKELRAENIEVK